MTKIFGETNINNNLSKSIDVNNYNNLISCPGCGRFVMKNKINLSALNKVAYRGEKICPGCAMMNCKIINRNNICPNCFKLIA